ncbi:UDP-2,3-diacetamido-2,3-dideoxy-D-glucuronate 2-epimerase [Bythopirellula goksoeyrii]|uniref:UDP-2,3-diacetamido-2,3-dideoxy-D-glucuronate 2-epimerase n=2 Tax=Bythopirellula goksoeyrii TaxID=1400387 RepID=A0A5B9QAD2_9BACT|nr:UDP-2,3-diacetamido-2,3-dideoxy-D-glucuronate 2-epimerase [Bythopirellula goksoeyrii]
MPIRLACIVGARPNFMKMAPIIRALENNEFDGEFEILLIHTGQHYDSNLSNIFFTELGMRRPDVSLEIGSGSHGMQTARILEGIESVLLKGAPSGGKYDYVVVVGDVNSTLAAALAAAKLGIRIAHVEAGLRSFDKSMPEEINRMVTDTVSDLLLVSEPAGVTNLVREGRASEDIKLVGNVMIDTLVHMLDQAKDIVVAEQFGVKPNHYGVITLHRPSNVDDVKILADLVAVLIDISSHIPLVFPVHPRTEQKLEQAGIRVKLEKAPNIHLMGPLGYLPFLSLTSNSRVIVTDSGGLQEESTFLGIPCLTLRSNTERPITVEIGTSTLIGSNADLLRSSLHDVLHGKYKLGRCPELWDGHAAERIATVLTN